MPEGLPPSLLQGRIAFGLVSRQISRGRTLVDLDLDFSKAAIDFSMLGWKKKRGEYAAARGNIRVDGSGNPHIDGFQISGPGLRIKGKAAWNKGDKHLPTIDISTLKIGGGTDTSVHFRNPSADSYALALNGGRVDVRPFLKSQKDSGTPADSNVHQRVTCR